MELLLDMVKCFKNRKSKYKIRAGLRRLFLLFFFSNFFITTFFSQAIPWSLETDFVCYFNAPLNWNQGFQNMEEIHQFTLNNQLSHRNYEFLDSISKTSNCDLSMIEKLFRSKIIIIIEEGVNDLFNQIENYLFDIQKQYSMILEALTKGILIIEKYEGLEELLEIISQFDVAFVQQGDFLIASMNKEKITEYQKNLVNRNEFSEDVLIYAETSEKNLTVTNAFSFLNIEIKTFNPTQEVPQFPIQLIEIPFETEPPENLFIFSNQKAKDFFYRHFEVISSVDEWQMIYTLIEKLCIYGFFYQSNNKWLLGFKSQNMYARDDSFSNQISKWGITQTETIKPYTNDYYLSVLDDYFMISNFKPLRALKMAKEYEIGQTLLDLQEKIGKREVYEVGYEFNENLGFTIYYFTSFDDRINRRVIRIF